MEKQYWAFYKCKMCGKVTREPFNPEYNPSGFPVLMAEKPEQRWGGVDQVRAHRCSTTKRSGGEMSRYGIAELIGWKTLEAEEEADGP
jgi:hypothetical protein